MKQVAWTLYKSTALFDLLAVGKILLTYNGIVIKHGGERGMLEYNKKIKDWTESEIMVIDLTGTPCVVISEREVSKL